MSTYLQEARRTLVLAAPIIVGQVSTMLMGVTDAIMIGHVGKVPLAASAFAGSMFGFLFMAMIGLLTPVSIMVSRSHGAGDEAEAAQWMKHGTVIAIVAGALGMALMLFLGTQLHHFGQPPEVLAEIHPYYELFMISMIPTLLFQVQRQFSESLERPVTPMIIMLAGVLLNVLLNWILIYGNWGAPALGLEGAGWATLLSRCVGVLVIWWWIKRTDYFKTAWPRDWTSNYTRARFKRMLGLGVPISLSLSFEGWTFGVAALMMGWLGSTALAAHQIAISCAAFTFMIPLGLAMAVSVRIGRAVGQKRITALRPIAHSAQLISGIVMLITAVFFVFAGEQLASAFVKEADVIALAGQLLVVAAVFQLADGGQVVAGAALRGLTDVKVPTVITAIAYWVIALPFGWWLSFRTDFGPRGVWVGLAVGLTLSATALIWRYLRLTRDGGAHVVLEDEAAAGTANKNETPAQT